MSLLWIKILPKIWGVSREEVGGINFPPFYKFVINSPHCPIKGEYLRVPISSSVIDFIALPQGFIVRSYILVM